MLRAVGAELRKLVHPVVILMVLVVLGFIWTDARTTFYYADLQVPIAVAATTSSQGASDPACSLTAAHVSRKCKEQLANEYLNDHFAPNAVALGRVTNSLTTIPGIWRFVIHELTTGLGWIFLAILLSTHVAGEWRSRTIGATLTATQSMRRFWIAKSLSVWFTMMGSTVAGTVFLYISRFTLPGAAGVGDPPVQQGDVSTWHLAVLPPDDSWASWSSSSGLFCVAGLMWLLLSMAGTLLAGLIRKPLLMLFVSIAGLSGFISLARWGHRTEWTPFPSVSAALKLAESPFGVHDVRLWFVPNAPADIFAARTSESVSIGGISLCVAIVLCLSTLLWVSFRVRRVIG